MKLSTILLLLLLLVGITSAQYDRVALEMKQTLPHDNGWVLLGSPKPSETVNLLFALKQQNLDTLEEIFWRVSDPHSPDYGQYMTLEQITELIRPDPQHMDLLLRWLHNSDVTKCDVTLSRDFLNCETTVEAAEKLLETTFSWYKHSEEVDHVILRASREYTVPRFAARFLDFIGGLHRVPNVAKKAAGKVMPLPEDGASFRYGVHPDTLRKRYNVSDHVGTNSGNTMATAQFLKQYYSPGDLKEFMYIFGGGFAHRSTVDHVIGPNKGKNGLEANLDVQYIMSLGANISLTFWSTGGLHDKEEPFLVWLAALSNTTEIPYVFSVSYSDKERTLSPEYMKRVNTEFMKTGLRGTSVLFASGDHGAGCYMFNDTAYTFSPEFPSSTPYITSVGGTMFTSTFSDVNEKGNDISGGGFSTIFEQPKYQQETVAGYLNSTKLPDPKYYNPKMRAYPDVSAMSDNFWIIIDRVMMNVAGTSAATPTVAGLIAMANDARLNAGKPPLGFLNPFIYQNPQIFFDVTLGTPSEACWLYDLEGYNMAEGWDPITGFGTPDYNRLIAAALKN